MVELYLKPYHMLMLLDNCSSLQWDRKHEVWKQFVNLSRPNESQQGKLTGLP
jgi:hypothetical protein